VRGSNLALQGFGRRMWLPRGVGLTAWRGGWLPDAMTDDAPKPATTPRADAAQQARLEREAAALRENLRRRKAQARARAEPEKPGSGSN